MTTCHPTPLLTRENTPTNPLTEGSPSGLANPLTRVRQDLGLTPGQFATKLQVTKAVVQNAELGFYNSPPQIYRRFLTAQDYEAYQNWRLHRRRQTKPWPPQIDTIPKLLGYFDCSPYQLAQLLCVQQAEIFRLLHRKARQKHIPSNLVEAFVQIGLSPEQIRKFSAN